MSALVLVMAGTAVPATAQDTLAEARLRKMEAEIRALQRQVFPGGDGKFFAPEITPGSPATCQKWLDSSVMRRSTASGPRRRCRRPSRPAGCG